MRKLVVVIFSSLIIPMCYAGSGGYSNDISDTRAYTQGSAVCARAYSAATNWYNPAGISFLEGSNVSTTFAYENANMGLNSDLTGHKIESKEGHYFIPSLFYTDNKGKWGWGVGLNSAYGLSTDWDNPVTDYVSTKTELTAFNLNPNFSYAINDQFSIAAGLDISYAEASMGKKINQTFLNSYLYSLFTGNNSLILSSDAESTLEGDDTAIGWNTAFMTQLNDTLQIGLTYRSRINYNLEGEATLEGLNGMAALAFGGTEYKTNASVKMSIPETLTLGIAKKISEKTSVEFDIEYTRWSAFNEVKIKYKETQQSRRAILNTGNPTNKDWDDTLNYCLGIEHQLNPQILLYGGTRYRPTPVPEITQETSLPSADLYEIATGLGIILKNSIIDFGLDYIWGDRSVNNTIGNENGTSVDGNYYLKVLILSISYSTKI